jgi:phage head maturation protease
VQDVILYDVSAVNRGAYPQTSIALRSLDDARETARKEAEIAAREAKRSAIADRLERKARQEQAIRRLG